jgi:hypothetical protein
MLHDHGCGSDVNHILCNVMPLLINWEPTGASKEGGDGERVLNFRTWEAKLNGVDARVSLADFQLSRPSHEQRNNNHSTL